MKLDTESFRFLTKKQRIKNKWLKSVNEVTPSAYDYFKSINDDRELVSKLVYSELMTHKDHLEQFMNFCNKRLYEENNSVFLVFTAEQGTGKTISMFYMAHLYKQEVIEIYTKEDLAEYLKRDIEDMKNKTVVFPDITILFNSRSWNTKLGKSLQKWINLLRILKQVVIMNIPFFEDADISIRKHFYECETVKIQNKRLVHINQENKRYTIQIPHLDLDFRESIEQKDMVKKVQMFKQVSEEIKKIIK